MSEEFALKEASRQISRLVRGGKQAVDECHSVAFPGARQSVWAGKVKSNASYNFYNVQVVEIGAAGSIPVEIGKEFQAVNLAEDFLEQGQLPAGRYVVLSRIGQKCVFYAEV